MAKKLMETDIQTDIHTYILPWPSGYLKLHLQLKNLIQNYQWLELIRKMVQSAPFPQTMKEYFYTISLRSDPDRVYKYIVFIFSSL